MSRLLAELKRRNVIRMAGLYLVGAWLLTQIATTVLPLFDVPAWALRALIIVLAVGFVPALIFAWVFELTPEGLKLDGEVKPGESIALQTARRMNRMIIATLVLALAYFGFDKFVLAPRREAATRQQTETRMAAARKQGGAEALVKSYGDKSIAVLPFVNMSPDKEQDYFSDGISEELLNQLAKIHELRVIARTSSFSYKGEGLKVEQIARELNVAHILEGSIRKSGNTLRVTAQLIRAADSSHLWSETFDRTLDDVFAVQDEIAAAVVAQLKIKLVGTAPKVRKTDPTAYALFLQARQLSRLGTNEGWQRSTALYQQTLAIDPSYAAAWAGCAWNYLWQVDQGVLPSDDGNRLAREAANKALALDSSQAWAEGDLGWIALTYDFDPAAAVRHYERALVLEPTNLDIIGDAGQVAAYIGHMELAIALSKYAFAQDPVNALAAHNLGYVNLSAGLLDDAIAAYRTALMLSPGSTGVSSRIGLALMLKGENQAALAAMEREPSEAMRLSSLAMAYHALGERTKSDERLEQLIARHERDASYSIATALAYRGEADRAFAWLDKAITYHDTGLFTVLVQPGFVNLHNDPRWLPLLTKLGLAPEQLAAIKFDVTLPGPAARGDAP
jgi:TolB-like protein/Tfp pilus assembly protein PilF